MKFSFPFPDLIPNLKSIPNAHRSTEEPSLGRSKWGFALGHSNLGVLMVQFNSLLKIFYGIILQGHMPLQKKPLEGPCILSLGKLCGKTLACCFWMELGIATAKARRVCCAGKCWDRQHCWRGEEEAANEEIFMRREAGIKQQKQIIERGRRRKKKGQWVP